MDGMLALVHLVFFFQAEDGIRDKLVTGVQTCALPICLRVEVQRRVVQIIDAELHQHEIGLVADADVGEERGLGVGRSEEHTSELQSLAYLVCRLLLEKKKKKRKINSSARHHVNLHTVS